MFSLLSGGLDSRMIAAALREQGAEVVACNFSPTGTQDQIYSGEAARALGEVFLFTAPARSYAGSLCAIERRLARRSDR